MLVKNILLLVGDRSQTFCLFMFSVICYGRVSTRRIMNEYVMAYLLQSTRTCLVKKDHLLLLKDEIL